MKEQTLKGYYTGSCYMGYVNGEYMPFATEMDYIDYMCACDEDYIDAYNDED